MTRKTWRAATLATTAVATAVTMTMAGAAYAVDVPTWKVGGYHPDCAIALADEDGSWIFVDEASPTVSLSVVGFVPIGNGPKVARTLATNHAKDACSGLVGSSVMVAKNGTPYSMTGAEVAPADGNYFDVKTPVRGAFGLADVGRYTFPQVLAQDRFAAFMLSGNYKTLGEVDEREPNFDDWTGLTSTDRYRSTASCVVRATTLSVSKNKSKVKKGKAVKVSGVLKAANGTGYSPVAGASVKLQRRVAGSKAWTTVGAGTTTSAGSVTISHKPKKASYYRLNYGGKCTAPWNGLATTGSTGKVSVKKK